MTPFSLENCVDANVLSSRLNVATNYYPFHHIWHI